MTENLTGTYFVRGSTAAFWEARKHWPKTRHRMEIRRHALKLRFWPEKRPTDDTGKVLDLDWSWMRALAGQNIGELRIDDTIGGQSNIRLIFFVGDKGSGDPMPVIWIIACLVKKRQDFTRAEIKTFEARRKLVLKRHYGA